MTEGQMRINLEKFDAECANLATIYLDGEPFWSGHARQRKWLGEHLSKLVEAGTGLDVPAEVLGLQCRLVTEAHVQAQTVRLVKAQAGRIDHLLGIVEALSARIQQLESKVGVTASKAFGRSKPHVHLKAVES